MLPSPLHRPSRFQFSPRACSRATREASSSSLRHMNVRARLLDNRIKRRRITDRQLTQHLSIQRDPRSNQCRDEAIVIDPACPERRVEPRDPELPERALLELAMLVGVNVGLAGEFQGRAIIVPGHPAHARGLATNAFAFAGMCRPAGGSWHGSVLSKSWSQRPLAWLSRQRAETWLSEISKLEISDLK